MSQRIPIETPWGILRGRDCVFLDKVAFERRTNFLILEGSINPILIGRDDLAIHGKMEILGKEFETVSGPSFKLTFSGVLAVKLLELDSGDFNWDASFEEIIDSEWIHSLGGKVNNRHRHFFLQTYDDLFDVVCETYSLECGSPSPD